MFCFVILLIRFDFLQFWHIIIMSRSKFNKYGLLIALITIVVSNFLTYTRRLGFYQAGLNFTGAYQASSPSPTAVAIFNLVYFLGDNRFVFVFLLVVHLLTSRKLNSLIHIAYVALMAYIISVEKQFYQEPRPCSFDDRIQVLDWTCHNTYGLPNGHSWFSVLIFEPVISDLIGSEGSKKGLLTWLLLPLILIPVSGLCLGSHSIDQAFVGLVHSLAALLLYKCLLQRVIYSIFAKALKGISLGIVLLGNTCCLLLSMVLPIYLYQLNINVRQPFTTYGLFMLNVACDKEWTNDDLQRVTGKTGAIIGIVFGFIYGFALMSNSSIRNNFVDKSSGTDLYIQYLSGKWSFKKQNYSVFKYLLVYATFGSIFIGFTTIFEAHSFEGEYVKQTILYCLMGSAVTFAIPIMLKILQVTQQNLNGGAVEMSQNKIKMESQSGKLNGETQ